MNILQKFSSLTVFRALLENPVIAALENLFYAVMENAPREEKADAYCSFVAEIYNSDEGTLSGCISSAVNNDENVYIRRRGASLPVSPAMEASVTRELFILSELASLTPAELKRFADAEIALPDYEVGDTDIVGIYRKRVDEVARYGYGIYAKYYVFALSDEGCVLPVAKPDPICLEELVDYDREKKVIIDNTLALINGKPAANMLLSGDAGTGKSSTVKAVVNRYHTQGVRILEVRRNQLFMLPKILGELSENPLKFIIFIDDLSFRSDDENFGALKAILEGSVSAKSRNVVIYATSNRRHLVKETFADREGDDIHRNDTMQEIISLSDRFGIQLSFYRPDKKTYLNIVHRLAADFGIDMDETELDAGAERFALGRGNRSARAARQYIDNLLSAR